MLSHAGEEGGVIVKGKIELSWRRFQVLVAGDAYTSRVPFRTDFEIPDAKSASARECELSPRFERLQEEAGLT